MGSDLKSWSRGGMPAEDEWHLYSQRNVELL